MSVATLTLDVSNYLGEWINATLLSPAAVIPSVGIAILTYLLVTRQLDMIEDDAAAPAEVEEFGTVGEANEWLGGPTSEWLGI